MALRFLGKIKTWNSERGFGFINPDDGGQDIFIHISEYPRHGKEPIVGEPLSFQIALNSNGKKKAINVQCPDEVRPNPSRHVQIPDRPRKSLRVSGPVLIGLLLYSGYQSLMPNWGSSPSPSAAIVVPSAPVAPSAPTLPSRIQPSEVGDSAHRFSCDGRRYCSQMTSCGEAIYFLRNCPDTEMDGDHDGVPCESQWCTGPLSK